MDKLKQQEAELVKARQTITRLEKERDEAKHEEGRQRFFVGNREKEIAKLKDELAGETEIQNIQLAWMMALVRRIGMRVEIPKDEVRHLMTDKQVPIACTDDGSSYVIEVMEVAGEADSSRNTAGT